MKNICKIENGVKLQGETKLTMPAELEFISPYDFDKTVEVMTERINGKDGWHVTEIIDQNKEVIENGGFAIGNFKIIKYCHGKYSAQMLKADDMKKIGNMMPKSSERILIQM